MSIAGAPRIRPGHRWSSLARHVGGYGAAGAMSLYLVVKIVWVTAGLTGHGPTQMPTTDWVALNLATVVMAGFGIALGLALAQPWGLRIPAPVVLFFSWVGAGFLVPLLPYSLAVGVLGALGVSSGGEPEPEAATPAWESVFISVGFTGMAIGLAIAAPAYMWRRWPAAFEGNLADSLPAVVRRERLTPLLRGALIAAAASGSLKLVWAFGGTIGLNPDRSDDLGLHAQLLNGCWGCWAVLGAWALWRLRMPRPAAPLKRWVPVVLAFAASGSAFAWGAWGLLAAILRPGGYVPAEYLGLAVGEHLVSIGLGVVILTAVLASRPATLDNANVRIAADDRGRRGRFRATG